MRTSVIVGLTLLSLCPIRLMGQEHDHGQHGTAPVTADSLVQLEPDSTISRAGFVREVFLGPYHLGFDLRTTDSAPPRQGRELQFAIRATDSTGAPFSGLGLAAWLDLLERDSALTRAECRERIGSYLQGSLGARPTEDLNGYFVVALNDGNTITVINPMLGFGTTKLFTTVPLPSVGEDWALDPTEQRLYVTMPRVNQVGLIETGSWKLARTAMVGLRPTRILMEPGGARVWVDGQGLDSTGTVSALDPFSLTELGRVSVGAGEHDLTFDRQGDRLYVTSAASRSIAVISTGQFQVQARRTLPSAPASVALADEAGRLFVGLTGGGLLVLDARTLAELTRLPGLHGSTVARISPDGRWLFVLAAGDRLLRIVDVATGQVRHQVTLQQPGDQVLFTAGSAYIRSPATSEVVAVILSKLDDPTAIVFRFEAGQMPPAQLNSVAAAQAGAVAPDMPDAIWMPNPGEKVIFFYHTGMNAPMGSLANYGWSPRAVLAVGRALREREPGEYLASFRPDEPGRYALAVLAHGTGIVQCFEFTVSPDSALARPPRHLQVAIDSISPAVVPSPGDSVPIRFRVAYLRGGTPLADATDLVVLVSSPTGINRRTLAVPEGEGFYRAVIPLPASGVYYLFVASPKHGVRLNDQSPPTITVEGAADRPPGR